jgi:transcriptional regulator with XRE-family HTH domain
MTKPTTPLEFIQAFRAKGLTQLQIEARTGIPQSAISKLERKQVHEVLSGRYLALQALYAELFPDEGGCSATKAVKRSPTNHPGQRAGDKKDRK